MDEDRIISVIDEACEKEYYGGDQAWFESGRLKDYDIWTRFMCLIDVQPLIFSAIIKTIMKSFLQKGHVHDNSYYRGFTHRKDSFGAAYA